jgi:hypothetical protein
MEPTVILFSDTWNAHNAPNFGLTPQIRQQRSQQSLDIDAVRLRSARTAINLQTCRVDRVVAYAVCFEQTVASEAVVARFVAGNDFHAPPRFSGNPRPDPLAQIQEPLPVAGLQRVAADLVRPGRVHGNNPTLLAQFNCKITAYRVIITSGGRQVVHCPGCHHYRLLSLVVG